MLKVSTEAYISMNDQAREAYVQFVNFAPSVQNLMQDVEKWHSQFDLKRVQTLEDFEEIDRLKTWYEYFLKSYQAFEVDSFKQRVFDA